MFQNETIKTLVFLIPLVAFVVGCSESEFSSTAPAVNSLQADDPKDENSSETENPSDEDSQQQVINDEGSDLDLPPNLPPETNQQIHDNTACQSLMNGSIATVDMQGKSFTASGNIKSISISNADQVRVNGNIGLLVINGANHVEVNGNIGSICIKTRSASRINGNLGSNTEIAIIGIPTNGAPAPVQAVSANMRSQVILINVDLQQFIGNFKELYLHDTIIDRLVGNGDDIHLSGSSSIEAALGNLGEIIQH